MEKRNKLIIFFITIVAITTLITTTSIFKSYAKIKTEETPYSYAVEESNLNTTKPIKEMYIEYKGFKIPIESSEETLKEIKEYKSFETKINTKLIYKFANVYVVYDKNETKLFGTIYQGADKKYYLVSDVNSNMAYMFPNDLINPNEVDL